MTQVPDQLTRQPRGGRRSQELITGGPPVAGLIDAPSPLGVPDDYLANRPGVSIADDAMDQRQFVPPLYFDGDDWAPASWSTEERARLQRKMENAGVIPKGTKYRIGIWDETSRAAYTDLLSFANAAGITVDAALMQYAQMQEQFPMETEKRQPLQIRQANPDDLRAVFDQTARKVIGRKLDEPALQRMVTAYQQAIAAPQQAEYNMGDPDGSGPATQQGGTITAAPSADTFAETQLRKDNPDEAFATDAGSRMNEYFGMLDGVV